MVVVVASGEVTAGKTQEAREWATRYAARMKKAFGVALQVMVPATPSPGQSNRIFFTSRHESITEWAEFFEKKEMLDPERQALVREGWEENQYFVANTFVRNIYRVL